MKQKSSIIINEYSCEEKSTESSESGAVDADMGPGDAADGPKAGLAEGALKAGGAAKKR